MRRATATNTQSVGPPSIKAVPAIAILPEQYRDPPEGSTPFYNSRRIARETCQAWLHISYFHSKSQGCRKDKRMTTFPNVQAWLDQDRTPAPRRAHTRLCLERSRTRHPSRNDPRSPRRLHPRRRRRDHHELLLDGAACVGASRVGRPCPSVEPARRRPGPGGA